MRARMRARRLSDSQRAMLAQQARGRSENSLIRSPPALDGSGSPAVKLRLGKDRDQREGRQLHAGLLGQRLGHLVRAASAIAVVLVLPARRQFMLVLEAGRICVLVMFVLEVVVVMIVGRRSLRRMIAAGEAHLKHRFQVAAAKLHPERRDDGDDPPNSVGQTHRNESTDSGRRNLLANSWPEHMGLGAAGCGVPAWIRLVHEKET